MSALQWLRYPHGCARLGLDLQRLHRKHRKNIHREITQHVPRVGGRMTDGEARTMRTLRVRYPFLVPWREAVAVARVVVVSRAQCVRMVMGKTARTGKRQSLTRRQKLMGWTVSARCARRCSWSVFTLLLDRHAANATPADACFARSDYGLIACARPCGEKPVSAWLHSVGQERYPRDADTATNLDTDARPTRTTQSRHVYNGSSQLWRSVSFDVLSTCNASATAVACPSGFERVALRHVFKAFPAFAGFNILTTCIWTVQPQRVHVAILCIRLDAASFRLSSLLTTS